MNAIISLCHFCELHGPSVILCTQAFHMPDPEEHSIDCDSLPTSPGGGDITHPSTPSSLNWFARQYSTDVQESLNEQSSSLPANPSSSSSEHDKAKNEACEVG